MAFGFFRTIWISLRAVNYTTRAFQDTITSLNKTQQAQIRFALNAKRNMMAVGMMYIAFGGIAMQTLGQIMSMSKYGEQVLTGFGESVGKSLGKLGETMARILKPFLDIIAKILEMAMAIPLFKEFASVVMIVGTVILFTAGMVKVFSGALGILKIQHMASVLMTRSHQGALTAWIPTVHTATGATISLSTALMAVFAGFSMGFGIVMAIYSAFGKLPAIIAAVTTAVIALAVALWSAAGGLSVLTFGAAAVAGGAAIAGAIAASQPEYQMGTSFVRKGGLAWVDEGEEIRSARESKVKPRWEETREYKKSVTTINISMGDVNTKADVEDMVPTIKRALKDALDNK